MLKVSGTPVLAEKCAKSAQADDLRLHITKLSVDTTSRQIAAEPWQSNNIFVSPQGEL
ncbi:MAG: hypothetical protein P8Y36_05440 [Alphaproteobacteria bacterium]